MKMRGESKAQKISLLIETLADGEMHSGESLGQKMGISRAGVWKYIKLLEELGLEFDAVRGQGYRIAGGLNLLNKNSVITALSGDAKNIFSEIDIFEAIDSTNEYLLKLAEREGNYHGRVCLAEKQTAGRGRRGRNWVSPFGRNVYCSLLWRFDLPMSALEGLSLVIALSINEALRASGLTEAKLKWPNDILVNGKKLAGILIEVRGDLVDYCDVVIGFGINLDMPLSSQNEIDQAWIDVKTATGVVPERNHLIGSVLQEIFQDLSDFEREGFSFFHKRWNQYDAFAGKHVEINSGTSKQTGLARGVNSHGALMLEQSGELLTVHGGELSLRGAE